MNNIIFSKHTKKILMGRGIKANKICETIKLLDYTVSRGNRKAIFGGSYYKNK